MFLARYAILLDGGFVTKKLQERLGRPATADDIVAVCDEIRGHEHLKTYELLRIYYYDAPPSSETIKLPVSSATHKLAETPRFRHAQSLYDQLELKEGFALRMGETRLAPMHWKLKNRTARELIKKQRDLTDKDFDLDIGQKGVDIRIGLDMARLALRDTVRAVAVVTGDSDFQRIPMGGFVGKQVSVGNHASAGDFNTIGFALANE